MSNAIGFRERSGTMFIDMAAAPGSSDNFGSPARKPKATIPEDRLKFMPWASWGTNNLLAQEMITDIETCGLLNAIIDGKARFGLCEGIVPAIVKYDGSKRVIEKLVDDPEIIDFLEMNNQFFQAFGWMKDLCGFGSGVARFMLNGKRDKIVRFQRDDITETRFEKKDPSTGKISNLFYSACWDLVTSDMDNRIFKVPLLDPNNPLDDLRKKAATGVAEHAMTFRYPGWGKHYYSVPLWYAAYKWVKIAQGVPEMKAAMFENNMRIKYMVVIYDKYWENAFEDWEDVDDKTRETRRNTLYDEIDKWLTGSKNAFKSIFVDGKFDDISGKSHQYIEIKPIEDNTKAGELLPDSAAANSEIAFAMMWNNAANGGNQKNNLYSENTGGSNIREATAMQVIIHELERKNIQRVMNVIKYFNGWNVTHPGLEFIIPATILTTLDTGATSKPVMTGGVDTKKEDTNGAD